MISHTSNVTKSKIQDIRGIVDSAKVKVLGVFVQFEIQSNSIQNNINLNDSISSNELKIKKSKIPKTPYIFGQGIIFGENNSKSFFVKLVQPK